MLQDCSEALLENYIQGDTMAHFENEAELRVEIAGVRSDLDGSNGEMPHVQFELPS